MAIFNSYVKLPEGIYHQLETMTHQHTNPLFCSHFFPTFCWWNSERFWGVPYVPFGFHVEFEGFKKYWAYPISGLKHVETHVLFYVLFVLFAAKLLPTSWTPIPWWSNHYTWRLPKMGGTPKMDGIYWKFLFKSGWWFQPTPLKHDGVSSSVGMMKFPRWWESHRIPWFQSPPTRWWLGLPLLRKAPLDPWGST